MRPNRPLVKYLVSSPYGDIPVDKNKWHLPLEGDVLKTPYKRYFHTIQDFVIRDELKPFLEAASKKLGKEIPIREVTEIIVRSEKHGFLYHPASIEVVLKKGEVKFGLNVAVSEAGKNWLREEALVLQRLHEKFNLPYLPRPYIFEEFNAMSFLLEDWFEGYHEFHISKDEEGKQRLKLWNFGDSGSGYRYLSPNQSFEIYKQTAKILTFYYDLKDYSQILYWHHAAGDFVVKIQDKEIGHPHPNPPPSREREDRKSFPSMWRDNRESLSSRERELIGPADKYSPSTGGRGLGGGRIDVRLTTARKYEPLMVLRETEPVNPFLALFYFFLNLTIKMHLDKLDGLGETVWMNDLCLEATVTGFFEALQLKKDEHYLDFLDEFLRLLETFEEEELKIAFTPLLDLYNGQEDYPVVMANLENHTKKLYSILQNHPL